MPTRLRPLRPLLLLTCALALPSAATGKPKAGGPTHHRPPANAPADHGEVSDVLPSELDPDPGPSPIDSCTSPTNCQQGDLDGDGISDTWEDKLALKFAPELRLPPSDVDWTRPANVDWYLERVAMRFEHDGCSDCEVIAKGAVTQDALGNQRHRSKNWRCKHKTASSSSASSSKFFLQPPDDEVHRGADPSQWILYVHVRRGDRSIGGFEVQYWYFFPYEDSTGSINHEGDWEHITVRVDDAGEMVSAWYAHHDGGTRYLPSDLYFVEGTTHPIVYIADGTHSSYRDAGAHDIPAVPGFDDHTYNFGPVWKTWTRWYNVGEIDRPRGGQSFIRYAGRWGEIGESGYTTGPRTPSFQAAWNGF